MQLKNINLPMTEVAQFCQKWNLTELALFGSVLRDDFRVDSSDIDVMVQFHPDTYAAFKGFDYFRALEQMESELRSLFSRDVDVVIRSNIEKSPNYLRRHEILSTAKVIYDSSGSPLSV